MSKTFKHENPNKAIDKAIDYYKNEITKSETDSEFYIGLSDCYRKLNQYEKAIEILEKGIEKASDKKILKCHIGIIYYDDLKNIQTALITFSQIISIDERKELEKKNVKPKYYYLVEKYLEQISNDNPEILELGDKPDFENFLNIFKSLK